MKIWIIKHKGKSCWGNMLHTLEVSRGKEIIAYAQECFYRKKDAELYLKTHYSKYPEYFEVVGCEVPKSKKDNRKI